MRAIVMRELGKPDVLRLEEQSDPAPGPKQVLIRVAAAGVNYADTNIRRGRYVFQPELPFVPGFEVAGTIAAVGPDVEGLHEGDRVAAIGSGGGYAELAVTSAGTVFPIPDGMSFVEAAGFPIQGLTAYSLLAFMTRVQPDDVVLVHSAAGGVGTQLIQQARLLGAKRIIATAGGPEKLALARELGADDLVDYRAEDFVARVNELTDKKGATLILDAVGGDNLARSFDCLASMGRLVTYGNASGQQAHLSQAWTQIRAKSQHVIGFHLSAVWNRPPLLRQAAEALGVWLRDGKLRVIVGHTFPLAEAARAHAALQDRQTTGKVVLTIE